MNSITTIIIVTLVIFLINIFFGYWRSNTGKLTAQWIMAIHIPVPIAIGLRLGLLGWNWFTLPIFVAAYAGGQFSGGKIRGRLKKLAFPLTSFLAADLYRLLIVRQKRKMSEPN
jgi:hypothetical protein